MVEAKVRLFQRLPTNEVRGHILHVLFRLMVFVLHDIACFRAGAEKTALHPVDRLPIPVWDSFFPTDSMEIKKGFPTPKIIQL